MGGENIATAEEDLMEELQRHNAIFKGDSGEEGEEEEEEEQEEEEEDEKYVSQE
jgi:hypothetical protein